MHKVRKKLSFAIKFLSEKYPEIILYIFRKVNYFEQIYKNVYHAFKRLKYLSICLDKQIYAVIEYSVH